MRLTNLNYILCIEIWAVYDIHTKDWRFHEFAKNVLFDLNFLMTANENSKQIKEAISCVNISKYSQTWW